MKTQGFAVESICAYRAWKQGRPVTARTVADALVIDALRAAGGQPESLYERRKMTVHLRRSGLNVAYCTVDRLMRGEGMNGVVRAHAPRTTVPGKDARRAGDLVNRDFTARSAEPVVGRGLHLVRTWASFVYVALAIDVFSQAIVGWHAMTTKHTDLVLTCSDGGPGAAVATATPSPSDWCTTPTPLVRYTSLPFTEHLALAGIAPSIGTVGDA